MSPITGSPVVLPDGTVLSAELSGDPLQEHTGPVILSNRYLFFVGERVLCQLTSTHPDRRHQCSPIRQVLR